MFIPASGKLSGVCTRKHYIILYKLLNKYYNINIQYIHNELTKIVSVCSNQSLNPLSQLLKSCSHAVCLMPYCLAGCGEWIWYREWILYWRLNLYYLLRICPVSWLEGKRIPVLANIGSELFLNVRCFIICELNNPQHSSRKLLFLLYQYSSEAWQCRLASCTQGRRRKDTSYVATQVCTHKR